MNVVRSGLTAPPPPVWLTIVVWLQPVLKDITPMNFFRVCAGPLDCNAPTASTVCNVPSSQLRDFLPCLVVRN